MRDVGEVLRDGRLIAARECVRRRRPEDRVHRARMLHRTAVIRHLTTGAGARPGHNCAARRIDCVPAARG